MVISILPAFDFADQHLNKDNTNGNQWKLATTNTTADRFQGLIKTDTSCKLILFPVPAPTSSGSRAGFGGEDV